MNYLNSLQPLSTPSSLRLPNIHESFDTTTRYLDSQEKFTSPVQIHEGVLDTPVNVRFSDFVPAKFMMRPRVQQPRDRTGELEG